MAFHYSGKVLDIRVYAMAYPFSGGIEKIVGVDTGENETYHLTPKEALDLSTLLAAAVENVDKLEQEALTLPLTPPF